MRMKMIRINRLLLTIVLMMINLIALFLFINQSITQTFTQRIFTDENAWLTMSAKQTIDASIYQSMLDSQQSYMDVINRLNQLSHTTSINSSITRSNNLREEIERQWKSIGLTVRTFDPQINLQSDHPLHRNLVLYGTLDGQTSDGKESIVIVVEYDSDDQSINQSNNQDLSIYQSVPSGLALTTALAQHLSIVRWLSRSIIFVAIDHQSKQTIKQSDHQSINQDIGYLAMERWVDSYMMGEESIFQSFNQAVTQSIDQSVHRSGSILMSLSIDFQFKTVIPINQSSKQSTQQQPDRRPIKQSINTGNPNLDVVSVLLDCLLDRSIDVSVNEFDEPSVLSKWNDNQSVNRLNKQASNQLVNQLYIPASLKPAVQHVYQSITRFIKQSNDQVRGLIRALINQSINQSKGLHSLFLRRNIDSLTLKAINPYINQSISNPSETATYSTQHSKQLLQSLNQYVRATNNLIEKLHHSSWLYFLINQSFYQSINQSVWFFVGMIAPLPLLAIALWMIIQSSSQSSNQSIDQSIDQSINSKSVGDESFVKPFPRAEDQLDGRSNTRIIPTNEQTNSPMSTRSSNETNSQSIAQAMNLPTVGWQSAFLLVAALYAIPALSLFVNRLIHQSLDLSTNQTNILFMLTMSNCLFDVWLVYRSINRPDASFVNQSSNEQAVNQTSIHSTNAAHSLVCLITFLCCAALTLINQSICLSINQTTTPLLILIQSSNQSNNRSLRSTVGRSMNRLWNIGCLIVFSPISWLILQSAYERQSINESITQSIRFFLSSNQTVSQAIITNSICLLYWPAYMFACLLSITHPYNQSNNRSNNQTTNQSNENKKDR